VIVERYDAILFDLDGVLYRGAEPIPAAAETIERLRRLGKRIAFVTNNAARTPASVVSHLGSVGIVAAIEEVQTSAMATAELLARRGVATAFVVGEEGLRSALTDAGIRVRDGEPDRVEAVVVGWDRSVDYAKLRTASILLQRGAAFVASNPDASFPAADGTAWPGAGALVAAIETTTGMRAEVVGKPHAPLLQAALTRAGGGRPLLVGDRLDTDIAGARALSWDSVLVLTGISTRDDVTSSGIEPTYILDTVADLVPVAE
jgi:glycerol 3-phosphatase-2